FIARKRKAIQDAKERAENARLSAIQVEEKRQAFEAGAREGKGRAALKVALAAYQEAQEQTADFEVALAQAKAHQSAVRSGPDPGNDKFAKALGSARDQAEAAQIRLERSAPILEDASRTLLEAILGARAVHRSPFAVGGTELHCAYHQHDAKPEPFRP